MSLHRLLPLYDRALLANEPLVLATVIRTGGSTYAKPGAQMLIAADGEYAGLLSGGCLEGDLREHARHVAASGQARIVSYDLRSTTDQLFGLGAGCEGAMDVLLSRVSAAEGWQPLVAMAESFRAAREQHFAFVIASTDPAYPLGVSFPVNGQVTPYPSGVEVFVAAVAPPPHLLLLGGGPDARPVATLAAFLGWRITVVEHRAVYLAPDRFPPSTRLIETRPDNVAAAVRLAEFSAAIVMSHHLESDLHYLRALARAPVPYVGLLGPAARREKLLSDLGEDAGTLRPRLRAPVGLDIGGRTPESIALAIVGEVHAALAGRAGRPFSETLKSDSTASADGSER
ncbi:MAG TPA: XdhC family protein [Steroidobacteraceae bacterium]|nr:XdhC family protein [Steroidobacteraceae bacterium]